MTAPVQLDGSIELRLAAGGHDGTARRFASLDEARRWLRPYQNDTRIVDGIAALLQANTSLIGIPSREEILNLAAAQLVSGVLVAVPALRQIAWGAKVSPAFKSKVLTIATNLNIDPDYLMACMAFETGETFSPSIKNQAGSGAVGLIQFMPDTAQKLGTTANALAKMTAVEQLDYVERYFRSLHRRISTVEDVYMAILWPAAIGRPNAVVLFRQPSIAYAQNQGLDANGDGIVTKAEAAAPVVRELAQGRRAGYRG
jgi:hypothetical protein